MTDNLQWMRVSAHLLTAINFGVIAMAGIIFLRRNDIGHRALIRMGIIFATLVSGDSMFGAWHQYHSHSNTFAMMRFGTAVFGTACVVYFMVTNQDVLRTLRISELWDRIKRDKLSDSEQARIQLAFVSQTTLRKSQDLVMSRRSLSPRGITGDGGTNLGASIGGGRPNGNSPPHHPAYPRT